MIDYKAEHEAFVSNLAGSSAACVLVALLHVPAFVFLAKYSMTGCKNTFLREFSVLSFPLLLTMTVFADYILLSLGIIFFMFYCALERNDQTSEDRAAYEDKSSSISYRENKHYRTSYLTLSKGATVLFTCIAILAVDFPIFPRWYGKTETFGISLMDFGVGSFMISTASTSKFARGLPTGREAFSMQRFVVLLLGVSRLVSVKLLKYQEHVSEYGVHWNFFMTLFFVWIAADIVHFCSNRIFVLFGSIMGLILYQIMLLKEGGSEYMMSDIRDTFMDANKEGIISLFGYIPLYLTTEVLSYWFLHADYAYSPSTKFSSQYDSQEESKMGSPFMTRACVENTSKENIYNHKITTVSSSNSDIDLTKEASSSSQSQYNSVLSEVDIHFAKRLLILISFLWILWAGCSTYLQPTSRRLCNLTYVLFSLALSFTLILFTYLADVLGGRSKTITTLNLMNKHSLIVFLVANVLTGIVNMLVQTIYASVGFSLIILAVYTLIVTAVPWVVDMVFSSPSLSKVKSEDETKLVQ